MSGEVEKCPILHVRPKFDVFTLTKTRVLHLFFFLKYFFTKKVRMGHYNLLKRGLV